MTEMFTAIDEEKVKAMYLMGENPVLSDPDAKHAEDSLRRLEFLVVQDIFLTETAKLAHVVLPATSFAERDGTFTNTERRVQLVRKAVDPIGNAKADWQIICQIAQALEATGYDFSHPSEIMDEIASITPSYAGITYKRLAKCGLQWPCPDINHPGTPILHMAKFTCGLGKFIPLEYRPPAELPDKEFPFMLTTGRSPYHFHTGTMTRKVAGLNLADSEATIEINPSDAAALNITTGTKVKVTSRRGEVVAKASVTDASPTNVVFMTFHFAEAAANILTNPALDPVAKIPEFKVCAVRLEVAEK